MVDSVVIMKVIRSTVVTCHFLQSPAAYPSEHSFDRPQLLALPHDVLTPTERSPSRGRSTLRVHCSIKGDRSMVVFLAERLGQGVGRSLWAGRKLFV